MKNEMIYKLEPQNFDVNLLRPAKTTCVDVQNMVPGNVGGVNTPLIIGGITMKVSDPGSQLSIVELPAPPNAHPWVPDPVRYVVVSGKNNWFTIQFNQPVKWAEINVAPGKSIPHSNNAVFVNFFNSGGLQSIRGETIEGPYRVQSIVFSSQDYVQSIGNDVGPPPKPQVANDISEVTMYSGPNDIIFWSVCYWL